MVVNWINLAFRRLFCARFGKVCYCVRNWEHFTKIMRYSVIRRCSLFTSTHKEYLVSMESLKKFLPLEMKFKQGPLRVSPVRVIKAKARMTRRLKTENFEEVPHHLSRENSHFRASRRARQVIIILNIRALIVLFIRQSKFR